MLWEAVHRAEKVVRSGAVWPCSGVRTISISEFGYVDDRIRTGW